MKTALITGSSRGIGKAIALRLASDGFKVIIHCSGDTAKAQVVRDTIISNGGQAEVLAANLCNLEETEKLADKAKNVDVLVLNASIQIRNNWLDITVKESYDQLNCNLISSLILMQKVVPYMKEKGWGRIITIGSIQEKKPHPDMLIYSAGKAAQTNMAESLANQLAPYGITVNNVAPGIILTDRNTDALSNKEYAKQVLDKIPAGYFGTPDDCAPTVSLLCSDEGKYITGQNIFIDGGRGLY